jgi:hypothetical protein
LNFFSVFTFYTFEFLYKFKKKLTNFCYFLNCKGKSFKIQHLTENLVEKWAFRSFLNISIYKNVNFLQICYVKSSNLKVKNKYPPKIYFCLLLLITVWGSGDQISRDQKFFDKQIKSFYIFQEIKSWNNNSNSWNSRDQKYFSGDQKSPKQYISYTVLVTKLYFFQIEQSSPLW